jgi:hypothetical protein
VFSDLGNGLDQGTRGPWMAGGRYASAAAHPMIYPTIQHEQGAVFKSEPLQHDEPGLSNSRLPQTASLLPLDYGRYLDESTVLQDPFFALESLFRICASAENQFLTLIDRIISQDTDSVSFSQEMHSFTNLLYYQDILKSRVNYLTDILRVIKSRGGREWPRAPATDPSAQHRANLSVEALQMDHERLLLRAKALYKQCNDGMAVMMNNAMLLQTQQAISQAKKVTKLTLIAFIYIPLSFSTSLFGMNVTQLGTDGPSMLIWVATSVPILIVTMLVYFIDADILQRMRSTTSEWLKKGLKRT